MESLGTEKIPRFYRGRKKSGVTKRGELYASPVDVQTLLTTIAQHRKNVMTRSRVAVRVMG